MGHKTRVAFIATAVIFAFLFLTSPQLCTSKKILSAQEILSWDRSTRTLLMIVEGKYFAIQFLNPNPESKIHEVYGLLGVLYDEKKDMHYEYLWSYMYADAEGTEYMFVLPDDVKLEDVLQPVLPEQKKVEEKKPEVEPVKPPKIQKPPVPKRKLDSSRNTAYA